MLAQNTTYAFLVGGVGAVHRSELLLQKRASGVAVAAFGGALLLWLVDADAAGTQIAKVSRIAATQPRPMR